MSDLAPGAQIGDPIEIRFDGMDAEAHEIELGSLAESLKGLSRILAVSGNFAATQRYQQHKDVLAVRVMLRPPEAHCVSLVAVMRWASQNQIAAGIISTATVAIVGYIFKRAAGDREEMKQLRGALDTAIKELGNRDQAVVDRLLDTVDKMADALRPAVRQAVAPLGNTARKLTIGRADGQGPRPSLDEADKEAIVADSPVEVSEAKAFRLAITELDVESGHCKLKLESDPEARVAGKITDPSLNVPNNGYALALASQATITVTAKATVKDGAIDRLFISDLP